MTADSSTCCFFARLAFLSLCASTIVTALAALAPQNHELANGQRSAAALAAKLGLKVIAVDPAYHGDVFYTHAAPESTNPVTRALTLVELRTQYPFWTLYIDRAAIDNGATRHEALAALGAALEYCPALDGRDQLIAATRGEPKTAFEAWKVVLGKTQSWSSPGANNFAQSPVWLNLYNGIDSTPLVVGGPTRAPQRLTLRLGCRG